MSGGDSQDIQAFLWSAGLWSVQPGEQAWMCGACEKKNRHGTKREGKGEVCERDGRACEDKGQERLTDKM